MSAYATDVGVVALILGAVMLGLFYLADWLGNRWGL